MRFLFFTPLLIASSLFAVTIKSVKYEGLARISPQYAQDLTGLKAGEVLNIEKINGVIKKLYAQNYFTDIYVEENDGDLVIRVKEKPAIAKIDIEGVGSNDKDVLLPALGVNVGMMYDRSEERRVGKECRL